MTREDAIICLKGIKSLGHDLFTEQKDFQECLDMAIEELQAVTIQPKTGRWVVVSDGDGDGDGDGTYICECSECKETLWVYKDAEHRWNYCPDCGAKMESEE